MPVHREGVKVFAYSDELDRWRQARTVGPSIESPSLPGERPPSIPRTLGWGLRWTLALVGIAATIPAIWLWAGRLFGPRVQPHLPFGRILARSTSEGNSPKRIALSHVPAFLAISPKGDKLFAANGFRRTLSIIRTTDGFVRTLELPEDGGPLAVSPNGRLYVGSTVEGITVVDIDTERILPERISTDGPVFGMALTPDGKKLFLAMGKSGVKRLSIRSGTFAQVSDRICPEALTMDSQGKRLYVAYQCSGPSGQSGHDAVEIFDVEKEVSLAILNDLPMVGALPSVSPDGTKVLLDSSDACSNPKYDHLGCKSPPSHAYHLLRTSDSRVLRTFEFPSPGGAVRFVDDFRFLMLGASISVVDATTYSVVEQLDLGGDEAEAVVVGPGNRTAYIGSVSKSIIVLELESDCTSPHKGLAMFFPADGNFEDIAGLNTLRPHGDVRFVPGRVGQAFFLNRATIQSAEHTGHFSVALQDWSVALYVKMAGEGSEMVLADWTAENPRRGIRLLKSADNRFVFQSWPDGGELKSTTPVKSDTWYHVAITRQDRELDLYVNGRLQDHGMPPPRLGTYFDSPLILGGQSSKQPSFRGWLDEIGFYNRALTPEEVSSLYQSREAGPCKL